MAKVLATIYKVTTQTEAQKADRDLTSTWTFGSAKSAEEFGKKFLSKEGALWYSVEGLDIIPCDEDKPDDRLYYGVVYMSFHEKEEA